MKLLILGGGVAAQEAALAARKQSSDATIELFSRETVLPYRRPALTKMVAESLDDVRFYLKPATFYEENRIAVHLGMNAGSLDIARKALRFADGTEHAYDKLLLAVGGRCLLPDIPGIGLDGVVALREYADLISLRARLDAGKAKRAVVLGGGLLGLELAESLLARGLEVTVLEMAPRLLPRQLDEAGAAWVFTRLQKQPGLTVRLGVTLAGVEGKDSLASVTLGTGEIIQCDLLACSMGIRANLDLAESLQCKRGIAVDAHMRTSDASVYAAGDCAELPGVSGGLFNIARDMGNVAGTNMAGGDATYRAELLCPARLASFGLKLFSVGDIVSETSRGGESGGVYRKLFLRDGRIAGGILLGDWNAGGALERAVAAGLTPEEAKLG